MVYRFINDLPSKKIFLTREIADFTFSMDYPEGRIHFDPDTYDRVLAIEPYTNDFVKNQINPIILRNRDEIFSRHKARDFLGIKNGKPVCFFSFSGHPNEYEAAYKTYSYLEDEGYTMINTSNHNGGIFPIMDYFNACDLLICGAGYNSFWEAIYFEKEAIFIPFPRMFEDQHRRVAECQDYRFEENGADQLVDIICKL
jgi:UDP:flavonoid glycosyltransferase YjiC (YdhE family)